MRSKPIDLGLGESVTRKCIVFLESRLLEPLFPHAKRRRRSGIAQKFRQSLSERKHKAQSVLTVVLLDRSDDPVPIHLRVSNQQPRKRFHNPSVDIVSSKNRHKDLRRIQWPATRKISKRLVPKSPQRLGCLITLQRLRIAHGENRRSHVQNRRQFRRELSWHSALIALKQRDIPLRHAELRCQVLLLQPAGLPRTANVASAHEEIILHNL